MEMSSQSTGKTMQLSDDQGSFLDKKISKNQVSVDNLDASSEEERWQLIEHAFDEGWGAMANLLEMY